VPLYFEYRPAPSGSSARLAAEIERGGASMARQSGKPAAARTARATPMGYHTVTPFVIAKGAARFLEFMKDAFGAKEIGRVVGENGSIGHAETRIGDSVVMTFDSKEGWPETPAFLRLYVDDCDAAYRDALKAGATSVTKMTNMPWGDRAGRVRDPLGNLWWIMTRVEDVDEEEIGRRAGKKEYVDAMQYVESAEFFPTRPTADSG
jgi:PhnB protein